MVKKKDKFIEGSDPPGGGKKAGKGSGFKKFIWNKEKKAFCGRTGVSWLKIFLFYIIFFVGLGAFFMLMLYIFFQTLHLKEPKWIGDSSLIGSNPGLGFRPMPDNIDSTLIWSKRKLTAHSDYWSEKIMNFTNHIIHHGNDSGVYDCEQKGMVSNEKVVCRIDLSHMGPCNKALSFGFDEGRPCIAIKLNKIYDWKPKPLDPSKDKKILDKMPLELKALIQDKKDLAKKYVWISCEGTSATDKENLGPIVYYPFPGISVRYFPYLNQPNYQQPFIFVQFPHLHPGVMISVECKAWAKNIINDKEKSGGRTVGAHFKLLMD